MAVLSCNNVNKSFGGFDVLKNITFSVNQNEKVAVVGDNGQGKTTLLRLIIKEIEPDSGIININDTIGYLSQTVIEDPENTLLEEMEKAFKELHILEGQIEALSDQMNNNPSNEIIDKYSHLLERYKNLGGYEYKYEIQTMLGKFGFKPEVFNRKVKTFSGGEFTRASFAKLLLNKPKILLLDEPTNHLDLVMIEWLEKYLKTYPGTVIVVSHDQVFIDNFASKIIEIDNHECMMFTGNYTSYVAQKETYLKQQLDKYNAQEKEVARLKMLIERFRYKPTKAAFAKSLEKKIDRMDLVERPNTSHKTIKASFENTLETKVKMHVVEDLLFGYNNTPLCEPLNLIIKNQDKICFMGQNGCGKTTLLQCLMTNAHKISGYNKDVRENLKYFYFDQRQEILNLNLTPFDTIHNEFPLMDNTEVRNLLGRFMFVNEDVFKDNHKLSGGEKIRLIFALLSLRKYDILYLDEPTNHLDFSTKKVIAEILDDYPGTIVFVSHDRYFINQVANKIVYIQNGKFIIEKGNYNDFLELHDIQNEVFVPKVSNIKNTETVKIEKPKNNQKAKVKLEKEIETVMAKIDTINNELLDESKASDWVFFRESEHQIKELEEKLEQLMLELDALQ